MLLLLSVLVGLLDHEGESQDMMFDIIINESV